jgi:hypothetical protein
MDMLNLDFLSSSGAAATSPGDFMNRPTDIGFRSDAGSATQYLHEDEGFMIPRVQDVSFFFYSFFKYLSPFYIILILYFSLF